MRIFIKRALQFDHPIVGAAEPVVVHTSDFHSVPDWVSTSTMFDLAMKDGTVVIIEGAKDAIAAELSMEAPVGGKETGTIENDQNPLAGTNPEVTGGTVEIISEGDQVQSLEDELVLVPLKKRK